MNKKTKQQIEALKDIIKVCENILQHPEQLQDCKIAELQLVRTKTELDKIQAKHN